MTKQTKIAGEAETLVIDRLKTGEVRCRLIGQTGLYFNAMSAKAMRDLLVGTQKKTAAEKKTIKHNPEKEFHDSVYRLPDGPTLLGFPAPAVKGAMSTAALETRGVTKASVQRLIFTPHHRIRVWGKPYLAMDVVRSADAAKTPDVRTRAFLPRWGAEVTLRFVEPTLTVHAVVSLLANAGMIVGLGDFRQEKGRGSFGTFRVGGEGDNDPEWDEIAAEGREVQQAAMDDPEPASDETAELLAFLRAERARRS